MTRADTLDKLIRIRAALAARPATAISRLELDDVLTTVLHVYAHSSLSAYRRLLVLEGILRPLPSSYVGGNYFERYEIVR